MFYWLMLADCVCTVHAGASVSEAVLFIHQYKAQNIDKYVFDKPFVMIRDIM